MVRSSFLELPVKAIGLCVVQLLFKVWEDIY